MSSNLPISASLPPRPPPAANHYHHSRGSKGKQIERKEDGNIDCEICCSTNVTADKVTRCSIGHTFCKDCARRMTEIQIGLHKSRVACMSMKGCIKYFEEREIQNFLGSSSFKLWQRIQVEEEIKKAGLQDLEDCPFCDFKAVIDSKEEKLFRCVNDRCRKISCRLCKTSDHTPRSCLEVELEMRERNVHQAEEQLSAILMRRCPHCKTPIVKEETSKSCNRMTCSVCRKDMCYCCRKDVTLEGYRHFDMEGTIKKDKCLLWEDPMERHKREIEEAKQKMGAKAPVTTQAEKLDQIKRRREYEERLKVVNHEFNRMAVAPRQGARIKPELGDRENRNWEAHGAVVAKKKSRQIEKDQIKIQQYQQDVRRQIETLRQREERLEALGFGSTMASQGKNWLPGLPFHKWDIGAEPIHLVVDVQGREENAIASTSQEAERGEAAQPESSALPTTPPCSPPKNRKKHDVPPNKTDSKPASNVKLDLLPTPPTSPAGRRTKRSGALTRAAARDFQAPI